MANAKLYNLARMTTATTGTGTITLGSAVSGFLSFASAGVQNGDTVTYAIKDGANSEIGRGVYTSSGTTLTRSVLKSTNSDAAINLSGSAEVFITAAAQDFGGAGGPIREILTANRTYYVRSDGSNSNTGLTNSSGGAFATWQYAYDLVAGTLDLGGKTVTIKSGNSATYTAGLTISQPWTGGGAVTLEGDTTTPSNVIISTTSASCIATTAPLPGALTIQGFQLQTTTSGNCIDHAGGGSIIVGNNNYGTAVNTHLQVSSGCYIGVVSNYTISGSASRHWNALHGGFIQCDGTTITLSGTPNFSDAFAYAVNTGKIEAISNTFSGSATGSRYNASANGVINTSGGGATYLPGNSGGSTATGGQYI